MQKNLLFPCYDFFIFFNFAKIVFTMHLQFLLKNEPLGKGFTWFTKFMRNIMNSTIKKPNSIIHVMNSVQQDYFLNNAIPCLIRVKSHCNLTRRFLYAFREKYSLLKFQYSKSNVFDLELDISNLFQTLK